MAAAPRGGHAAAGSPAPTHAAGPPLSVRGGASPAAPTAGGIALSERAVVVNQSRGSGRRSRPELDDSDGPQLGAGQPRRIAGIMVGMRAWLESAAAGAAACGGAGRRGGGPRPEGPQVRRDGGGARAGRGGPDNCGRGADRSAELPSRIARSAPNTSMEPFGRGLSWPHELPSRTSASRPAVVGRRLIDRPLGRPNSRWPVRRQP